MRITIDIHGDDEVSLFWYDDDGFQIGRLDGQCTPQIEDLADSIWKHMTAQQE